MSTNPIDALEVLLAPTSAPDLSSYSLAMDAPQNSLHMGFLLGYFPFLLPLGPMTLLSSLSQVMLSHCFCRHNTAAKRDNTGQ